MKKVALYSSSNRSRGDAPGATPAAGQGAQSSAPPGTGLADGSGNPPPPPSKGGRLRRFYRRFEQPILVAAGALFAVALLLGYANTRPVPQALTQKDIDAAVMHTLESANLPSMPTPAIRQAVFQKGSAEPPPPFC